MRGILADNNVEGHLDALIARMAGEPWREFWDSLGLAALTFERVGLPRNASDRCSGTCAKPSG